MADEPSREHPATSGTELGDAARRRRREQGLTQERLADLAGTHRNQIRKLETGKTSISVDLLLRVLGVLGLELSVRNRDAHRGR